MSGSEDDWEKQLEDEAVLDQNLQAAKKKKFEDEDAYDSEEERKKAKEELKAQQSHPESGQKKKGAQKKDYDKMFEERLAQNKGANYQKVVDDLAGKNLSKDARGELLSKAAEQDITEALFADIGVESKSLMTEKDYISFGKKVAGVLYQGQAPYKIPAFFREALRDVQSQLESKRIKEILDTVTTLYNEKWKEEKDKEKSGKGKQKKQPQLAAGKNTLNQQMMSDLLGDDDYGEEDDYGDEDFAGGKKKVQEGEYDFM
jgi:hypothetical protein